MQVTITIFEQNFTFKNFIKPSKFVHLILFYLNLLVISSKQIPRDILKICKSNARKSLHFQGNRNKISIAIFLYNQFEFKLQEVNIEDHSY